MAIKVLDEKAISDLPKSLKVNLVNSLSGFKSANLIGTTSKQGINNLAIVSSVFHVGANPPLIGLLMRPHTVVRNTLQNIKETGVYTINHVHKDMVKQAHQTSARYDANESEFEEVGLHPQKSAALNAPFVEESRIKIALKVEQITKIPANKTELVIGRVVEILLHKQDLHIDGYLDIEQAQSVVVSGLDSYHETFRIDRFSYAKPHKALSSIWGASVDNEL